MNKNTKIIITILVIIIIVLGYLVFKPKPVDQSPLYKTESDVTSNKVDAPSTSTISPKPTPEKQGQAAWYIPNKSGWIEHTLDWKTYSIGNISFRYPTTYVVTTKRVETRPDVYIDQTTITDPSARSETDDTIYLGVPYTGANDPTTVYYIKENINNNNISLSIRKDASSYAKYILENIAASVVKN